MQHRMTRKSCGELSFIIGQHDKLHTIATHRHVLLVAFDFTAYQRVRSPMTQSSVALSENDDPHCWTPAATNIDCMKALASNGMESLLAFKALLSSMS